MICKNIKYIAIEGCIGVGKTTLSNILTQYLQSTIILENIAINPFIHKFYKYKSLLAFKTQLYFLISRYKQQKLITTTKNIISDYTIFKDNIFANINLTSQEQTLYKKIFIKIFNKTKIPNIIIYLTAPLNIIYTRIQHRGRYFEKNIHPNYLHKIIKSYNILFNNYYKCPIIKINTHKINFYKTCNILSLMKILNMISNIK